MDTLDGTDWDVVIAGTGLPQSLLALALSRTGKKILHVDRNLYYGSDEAAFSLQEAEEWAHKHAGASTSSTPFSNATISKPRSEPSAGDNNLLSSRSYSLTLSPQLLYTRSALLPALVSSKTHGQLDFQAVGSWFIAGPSPEQSLPQTRLTRVPGGREDVFQTDTLDLKSKRSLMKFLRFVANHEDEVEKWGDDRHLPLTTFLEYKFGLPPAAHPAIIALVLSTQSMRDTTVESSLPRIKRHLQSIGMFGPGFAALLPKYGGLAEIGQVACRAGAVGGGVYVLGKGVDDVHSDDSFNLSIQLSDGEQITTKWLAGTSKELPGAAPPHRDLKQITLSKCIAIVSSPLACLFPPTSEGGVTPAGAVIMLQQADDGLPPVHILAHSSDSGECPRGQCALYASVADPSETGFRRLDSALSILLSSVDEQPAPQVLWIMRYQQGYLEVQGSWQIGPVLTLRSLPPELTYEDAALDDVKAAWQRITNENVEAFMRFEARDGAETGEDSDL